MGKLIDLTGQTFGELTVLSLSPIRKSNRVTWHCKCSCGNEIDVIGSHLKTGHTRSCGCLQKQVTSRMNPAIDITNQRFGRLVAIKRSPSRNKHTYWVCQCDCGNICEVRTNSLTTGHTTSCGCIQSKGEEEIAKWLQLHGIPFERQKTFDSCRNSKTNYLLRFDFYIGEKFLLEYDGVNHFKSTKGWNYKGNVEETKERDAIKTQWAKDNNIPLVRISYNDCYNSKELEDILTKLLKEELII